MLLTGIIVLLLAPSTQARILQASLPVETAVRCSVKKIDDDGSAMSSLTFSGRVRSGESYQCAFIQGFVFGLEPTVDGWEMTIHEDNRTDNLAYVTPSENGHFHLLIAGSDFASGTNSSANPTNAKITPDRRNFSFSPIPATRRGSLTVSSVRLDNQPPGANPRISEMSFEVSIRMQAIDGIPLYMLDGHVKPPTPVKTPNPEYSREARDAKIQGTVVLWVIVDPDGRPRNIKVNRSVGMGLDEKAIEAVSKWKFKSATKDGNPVPVAISVEVTFHL
jgi:TonB family protein